MDTTQVIKARKAAAGITWQQIAEKAQINPDVLKDRIAGRSPWREHEVHQLAAALGFAKVSDFYKFAELLAA